MRARPPQDATRGVPSPQGGKKWGMAETSTDGSLVTIFWRPGCFFCHRLLTDLHEAGIGFALRNIWDDADAAAFVRSVARGNETVPTVTVGDAVLVNPAASDVASAAEGRAATEEALPAGSWSR